MKEFAYDRPSTLAEAVMALGGDGARVLAGGTDLIPQMREGRRQVARIIDVKRIPELTEIAVQPDGGVVLGAAASASSVARHPAIARDYPAVAQSARLIGSLQVQNRASLGGNVCNAAPSADAVPALICLQARTRIAGPHGGREVALEELFVGPGKTTLAQGELLAAITLPPPAPRAAACYLRFTPRREMDIAIAGAGAWFRLAPDGTVAEARITLASVGPTPVRASLAEQHLRGAPPTHAAFVEAGRLAAQDARPISDTRGSAAYRRQLVAVLTTRALMDAARQLGLDVSL